MRTLTGPISTRTYLIAFSLALVLPIITFGVAASFYYASLERARLEQQASLIARQMALILDGDARNLLSLLTGLASSTALRRDDLADFHAQASRLVEGQELVIVLRTLEGEQLVNTQVPFGQPLPPAVPLTETDREAYEKRQLRVSDVYSSPISGEVRVAIAFRPLPQEKPGYLLAVTVPTSRFLAALKPAVPEDWLIGVGDRRGVFVTRSRRHDELTGKPGLASYRGAAVGRSGTFYTKDTAGVPVLAGYYRSDLTGWLVAANIPSEVLEAPLLRSLFTLVAGAALVLALSSLAALLLSRRLTGAAHALAVRAEAVGRGHDVEAVNSGLLEFSVIDRALDGATDAVKERAKLTNELVEAVQQKDMLFREVNHRVKNSLQLVASLLNLQRNSIRDPEARRQFEEAAARINTVARVHQRLYRDERLDRVGLHLLISELCEELEQLNPQGGVRVECEADEIFLPTDRVIPIALILNELVVNAFKHGFAAGQSGSIRVECRRSSDGIRLTISDNGANLSRDFDPSQSEGLGMKMINALARQLRAKFEIARDSQSPAFSLHVPAEHVASDVASTTSDDATAH